MSTESLRGKDFDPLLGILWAMEDRHIAEGMGKFPKVAPTLEGDNFGKMIVYGTAGSLDELDNCFKTLWEESLTNKSKDVL